MHLFSAVLVIKNQRTKWSTAQPKSRRKYIEKQSVSFTCSLKHKSLTHWKHYYCAKMNEKKDKSLVSSECKKKKKTLLLKSCIMNNHLYFVRYILFGICFGFRQLLITQLKKTPFKSVKCSQIVYIYVL